jgi:two-component system NtrC family sensor kinase
LNIRRIRSDEERKHLVSVQRFQDKLDQAAKLASIGELVDSVAHEINTPIGVIASTLDALLIDGKMSHELEDLETIRRQVKRIKGYTRGLLGYSRRLPFNPTENDILEVIEECVFLVRPRIRQKQADFRQHIPQRFAKFVFDRPRIEQVIINLLNNGLDSLEKPGVIELRLQQQAAEDTSESSSWCILEVKDSGAGIPEDQIGKIFDPFFSTKALTEGTGLGLSISKSIVERHRGRITVASKPGQGSTFSVWLPMEVSE